MTKYIAALLLFVVSTSFAEPRVRPDSWAKPIIDTELDNLFYVDEGVFRSEQPHDENMKDLMTLGVKEILSLREFHGDKDDITNSHFTLHRVRIDTDDITEEQVIKALRIIKNRQGPILIHCWHGSDRTGTVIAAYRVVFNGWSKAQAVDEMANGGFGYHARVYPELVKFVENLDVDRIKKAIN